MNLAQILSPLATLLAASIAGLLTAIGLVLTLRRDMRHYRSEEESRRKVKEDKRAEDARKERERADIARVSVDLRCDLFGPMDGGYVCSIRIIAENKGKALRHYDGTAISLRGIGEEDGLRPRGRADRVDHHLSFPRDISSQPIGAHWTVEPDTRQTFHYRTVVPADVRYLLVRAKLTARDGLGSWEERVFPVVPTVSHAEIVAAAHGRAEPVPHLDHRPEPVGGRVLGP